MEDWLSARAASPPKSAKGDEGAALPFDDVHSPSDQADGVASIRLHP